MTWYLWNFIMVCREGSWQVLWPYQAMYFSECHYA